MKNLFLILGVALALTGTPAYAETADITIANTVMQAIAAASASILPMALKWLGSLMMLQFVLTNIGLMKSGADLEAVFAKLIGSLLWFGFCFYVIEKGPDFIDSVGSGILGTFAPNIPTPGSIITSTLALCTAILGGIAVVGSSIVGTGNSSLGQVLVGILFFVFAVGMGMAVKIMMLYLELGLVVMLSPLSFAMLGINALKDQGIAPFKALISLIYRVVVLGVICAAFSQVMDVFHATLNGLSWAKPWDYGKGVQAIFAAVSAYPVIAYLAWKSDSIAASLASGSTNMGPADVASAAAAGAAFGAASMSAGNATTSKVQSMADFMKNLNTGGGEIKNAGAGVGGLHPFDQQPVGTPPATSLSGKPTPSAWMNGGRSVGDDDDQASSFGSNSYSPGGSESLAASGSTGSAGRASSAASDALNPASSGYQSPFRSGMDEATRAKSRAWAAKHSEGNPAFAAQKAAETGSGATAGIGSAGSGLEQRLGDLVDTLSKPKNPTLSDRLGEANRHVEKESAATHISINTHHSDH